MGTAAREERPGATSFPPPFTGDGPAPMLCGADVELGNFIESELDRGPTGAKASRALLREVVGVRNSSSSFGVSTAAATRPKPAYGQTTWPYSGFYGRWYASAPWGEAPASRDHATAGDDDWDDRDPQDWGRKFLPANGGCAYIDLDHLELCLPEVRDPRDFVAAWHGLLLIAEEALHAADDRLGEERRLHALVNNSDGRGHSYGSHVNFLVTRRCFVNLFDRKLHHMLVLASHLTSSIVFTGAGKVGSENRRPATDYQIAQRADFFETLAGPQTTYRRPIVNSRDESLCGSRHDGAGSTAERLARLHVIFFDNTLSQVANFLKVGATQIVLAMLQEERADGLPILDNPLRAVLRWSHDPTLRATERLVSRKRFSAVDCQEAVLERAAAFVAKGRCEGLVPRAEEVLSHWNSVLEAARARDMEALARKTDWALKKLILEGVIEEHGLAWASPEVRHLGQTYSSLRREEGLYWAYEQAGLVDRLVSAGDVERFVHEPPHDTRAWLRAHVLRRAEPETIVSVDWDKIRFRTRTPHGSGRPLFRYWTLRMDNPFAGGREDCSRMLEDAPTLEQMLAALGAQETDYGGRSLTPVAREPGAAVAYARTTQPQDAAQGRRRTGLPQLPPPN